MAKYNMWAAVGKRFLKGFVSGAVASMVIVVPSSSGSLSDLKMWLMALTLAGLFGGISGFLLALEKWSQSWSK